MAIVRSIGTDTELFGKKGETHKALCGLIGGTKDQPKAITSLPRGFALQEDNVAVEFNIPPTNNAEMFDEYIEAVLRSTSGTLKDLGMTISQEVAVSFDLMELVHPTAMVFGCDPDYSAWTNKENPRPISRDENLRTAGGHIHVGSDANMIQGVQMMDLFLGVPSVLLDDSEGSVKRRELYGKAGAMRPKPYGWEYRVLSNYWVFSSNLRRWVFHNTVRAVQLSDTLKIGARRANMIQGCINKGLKEVAQELINIYNIPMPRGYNGNNS